MARGFKWVEYGGLTGSVTGVITSHTYIANSYLDYLDFGNLNRQPFSSSSSKNYFGLVFYGFQPSNLRISIQKPFADCFPTGINSVSELNKNLIQNGFDFRVFNFNAPTIMELNPCVGISTTSIPGFIGFGTTAAFPVGISPTYFSIPYNADQPQNLGIGSRLIVAKQNDPVQNGIYTVLNYNQSGPNGQPIMTLVSSGELGNIFPDYYHYRVKLESSPGVTTNLAEYYGLYWNGYAAGNIVGMSTLFWIPQPKNLFLGTVKVFTEQNYNLNTVPTIIQNVPLYMGDRLLVANQINSIENGLYKVVGFNSTGANNNTYVIQRDIITNDNLATQMHVYIESGSGLWSGYYFETLFNFSSFGLYTPTGFAYSTLMVGVTSIGFQYVNEFNNLASDSPASWAPMPTSFNTSVVNTISSTVTNYQPLVFNTLPSPNNPNIYYSDILAISIRVPSWQQDSNIRGLNVNVEFDILN